MKFDKWENTETFKCFLEVKENKNLLNKIYNMDTLYGRVITLAAYMPNTTGRINFYQVASAFGKEA